MRTALGQELAALAEAADGRATPPAADLWAAGRQRRRWAAARSFVVVALVFASLAFVVWPGVHATPAPPVSTAASGETPRTYPSLIAEPHFPRTALEAHRPMFAVYVARQTLFAVDDHGQTWKAPKRATHDLTNAALSPDGRYATDGAEVYDFVAGRSTRLTAFDSLTPENARIGAGGWSPDSSHYAVIADTGVQAKVGVGTPGGGFALAPVLPTLATPDVSLRGVNPVRIGWLDNTRVLLLVPAAPTPEDATRGSSLMAFTWAFGDEAWEPIGALRLPPSSGIEDLEGYAAGVSPDGRTVANSVYVQGGRRSGVALMTWPLPSSPDQTTTSTTAVPASGLDIDGITWRGQDLVVSRHGITTVVRTGQVLSEAGSGSGRPISWRAGAFEGAPYYNTAAVWRDRLFVWAILLGTLIAIALGIRLARPVALRAGLLSDRYASPFPIEARWFWSR
jgi:hypothetical protein